DIDELLLPEVAARKRELHAGENIAVGRNIAGGVTGAARETVHDVFARRRWWGAEFLHVPHQLLASEDLLEIRPRNAQREYGCISIHFRRDGGVKGIGNP